MVKFPVVEIISRIDEKVKKTVKKFRKHYRFGEQDFVPRTSLHVGKYRSIVYSNFMAGEYRQVRVLQTEPQKERAERLSGKVESLIAHSWKGANRWSKEHARMGLLPLASIALSVGLVTVAGSKLTEVLVDNIQSESNSWQNQAYQISARLSQPNSYESYQLIAGLGK